MKNSNIKSKQYWRERFKTQLQHRNFKKQIFGQHYNFTSVKINNNKRYFNQQVKIMQIERSNRLLLEKIKKISQRSKPRSILQRARTEVLENQIFMQRSQTQQKQLRNKLTVMKNHQPLALSKTRLQSFSNKKHTQQQDNKQQQGQSQRIVLYRGRKTIQNVIFSFTIYIEKQIYTILSQSKINQQKIEIPLLHYKFLLKQQLQDNHSNIFKLLKFCQNNKLQLKGSKKFQVDVVQKSSIELPLIKNKNNQGIVDV